MSLRPLVWIAAAAIGVGADLWVDVTSWRLALGLGALLALALPEATFNQVGGRGSRTWILGLLAVASLCQSVSVDLWRFTTSPQIRVWNVYHYYLGAKYFDELGYHDLYDATLKADRQGADYWRDIERVRNLRTYRVEDRSVVDARYRPGDHFSAERWQQFRHDVAALQPNRSPGDWRRVFTDRGYNPSPFWTVVGNVLAGHFSASNTAALKALCALDLLLFGATFWLIRRVFGTRVATVVVLFFTLTPVNTGRLIGGFLQYDWFCAAAAGLCFARRGRQLPAAALFAYATLARIFPGVFVAAAAVPPVVRWLRDGHISRKTWRFFFAFGLFCGLGFGLGSLTGHGIEAWREFGANLGHHSSEHLFGERRIGLQQIFTHDLRSLELEESKSERRELFERQEGLYQAAAGVLLVLFLLAAWRRNFHDALLLGLVPLFALAVSSRYYWALLALLPLLSRAGPAGAAKQRWFAVGQAGLFIAYYAFELTEPRHYPAYSLLNLWLAAFLVALIVVYLRRDLVVIRRRNGVSPPWHQSTALVLVFFIALFMLLCFLRLPLKDYPIRDVDESVSALIAASWLEGGVPYRDAIDQRGPVTYLIYALIFAVSGIHNMWAVHWGLLLLILLIAFLLFLFGRQLRPGPKGAALGYLAAFFFVVSSYTYRRSQMLAFHTEWPMALASCLAMIALWQGLRRGGARPFLLAGACYAGTFLSKQPGIFDAAAGGLFVLLWQGCQGRLVSVQTARRAALLAAGFAAVLGGTATYFWAAGGLPDFYLYFWKYNVEHYAKIVGWGDRLAAMSPFAHGRHYLTANPLLLIAAVWQLGAALWTGLRERRVDARTLLALWFLFAFLGASYSGRNFGHYFIQLIAPACLLAGWLVHDAWERLAPAHRRSPWLGDFAAAGRWLLTAAVVLCLLLPLHRFSRDLAWVGVYRKAKTERVRQDMLETIAANTRATDTIFVWGYYPELYVLSGRRPATRYSNTNYLTGMLPWENHQPGIDTSEHIVDGAWDILMRELKASRPELILDTSVGDHRFYQKYPVVDFPRLAALLDREYVRAERILDRRGEPAIDVWTRRP